MWEYKRLAADQEDYNEVQDVGMMMLIGDDNEALEVRMMMMMMMIIMMRGRTFMA